MAQRLSAYPGIVLSSSSIACGHRVEAFARGSRAPPLSAQQVGCSTPAAAAVALPRSCQSPALQHVLHTLRSMQAMHRKISSPLPCLCLGQQHAQPLVLGQFLQGVGHDGNEPAEHRVPTKQQVGVQLTREHHCRPGCSSSGASWSRRQRLEQQLASSRQRSLSSMPARVGSSRVGSTARLTDNPTAQHAASRSHRFISTVASTKTKRQASTEPATAGGRQECRVAGSVHCSRPRG